VVFVPSMNDEPLLDEYGAPLRLGASPEPRSVRFGVGSTYPSPFTADYHIITAVSPERLR
jgi:hypothetical protein